MNTSFSMLNKYLLGVFFMACLMMAAAANTPIKDISSLSTLSTLTNLGGSCSSPSEQALRCLGEWACRHAIRLDLRCLLNVNGIPLLGGILGGTGLLGGAGGGGGAGGVPGGAGNGLLGGLLGR